MSNIKRQLKRAGANRNWGTFSILPNCNKTISPGSKTNLNPKKFKFSISTKTPRPTPQPNNKNKAHKKVQPRNETTAEGRKTTTFLIKKMSCR